MGILGTLILCGLMGLVGQGIRAAVGLKSAATLQAQNASQQTQFDVAYFILSLMLGFVAGIMAGFVIGLDKVGSIKLNDPDNTKLLFAIMAAGYAGVDFIENAFTNLLPKIGAPPILSEADSDKKKGSPSGTDGGGSSPSGADGGAGTQTVAPIPDAMTPVTTFTTLSRQVADIHAALTPQVTSGSSGIPSTTYPASALKVDARIAQSKYWQDIIDGAQAHQLPVSVIAAIGSKESRWGLLLKPPGPAGTGDFTPRDPRKWGEAMPTDGLGWGRGLMQLDWYSNDFAKTGNWHDARANILYGCALLAEKIKKYSDAGADANTALRCGVSAYNGMSGPNSPYCNDVMARADWIHKQGLDVAAPAAAAA